MKMSKLKPLNLEKFARFDVDSFIREFEEFEVYFKERVKLINKVSLKQEDDCFIFTLDTPSTDLELELGTDKNYEYDPPKTCYYLAFDMFPIEISYLSISKEQYESILRICKGISENAKEREEEFNKARVDVLVDLLQKIDWRKLGVKNESK